LGRIDGVPRVGPDVIITGRKYNIAIERKDTRDFISSVVKKHIFEQVYDGLCQIKGARPVLLIEGSWRRAFVKREQLYPLAMASYSKFVATTPLQIVHADSAGMTATMVKDWDIDSNEPLEDEEAHEDLPQKVFIPARKPVGARDIAYTMLMSIPGIGPQKALDIVKRLPEPKSIASLTVMEESRLKKLFGEKKGELAYHVYNMSLERTAEAPLEPLKEYFEMLGEDEDEDNLDRLLDSSEMGGES
jgi:ERCC4-type nuclease